MASAAEVGMNSRDQQLKGRRSLWIPSSRLGQVEAGVNVFRNVSWNTSEGLH